MFFVLRNDGGWPAERDGRLMRDNNSKNMDSNQVGAPPSKNQLRRARKQEALAEKKSSTPQRDAHVSLPLSRRHLRVAIVGGGLCGFGAALLLKRAGCSSVSVFERDETLAERRQGYGLTILQGGAALQVFATNLIGW